jgi:hypothetical protein
VLELVEGDVLAGCVVLLETQGVPDEVEEDDDLRIAPLAREITDDEDEVVGHAKVVALWPRESAGGGSSDICVMMRNAAMPP